jgi:DNA ligase (NAD+)
VARPTEKRDAPWWLSLPRVLTTLSAMASEKKASDKKGASTGARVVELGALLKEYKHAYYNGQPLVSDAAYDALEDELRELDPEHEILQSIGAPVPKGKGEVVTEWEKARHAIPMGSLNKVVNEEEFHHWIELCEKLGAAHGLPPLSTGSRSRSTTTRGSSPRRSRAATATSASASPPTHAG